MRKLMVVSIPIFTLAIFVILMLSGDFLKKQYGENKNIPEIINDISDDIINERWDVVDVKTGELELAWKKVVRIVQFSSERDEINFFDTAIVRLKAATKVKDRSNALMEVSEALEHWKDLGR